MKQATLVQLWADFWGARTPREKAWMLWGSTVLGVVLAYSVLWAPAQQGRKRLSQTLPVMQRQLAQMTAQAAEARALSASARNAAPEGVALKQALTASLAEHEMATAHVRMIGRVVQIELKNVSFSAWTMWLDSVRKQFKVQLTQAHTTALKADGQVDVVASLQAVDPSK